MLRERKAIFFIFISHSLLRFGSSESFKVLSLDFELLSSEVHRELENLETKTIS